MKGKKKSEKKKGDKKLPTAQQESAPVDNSGTSSAPPVEPKKAIPEKANPEQTIPEQTIPEQNIPKPPKNDKQPDRKGKKTKKIKNQPKKASFFGGLFSAKRLFIYYILSVFFWCDGKTLEQCNSYEEVLCFNGISQYILNHDYFHKFIEPKITVIKQNVEVYGKHALDTASVHAKPYVNPILESAQPHLQTASELSVEYVYIPVAKGLTKTRELYNENAKDHVNKFYHQAVKFSAPYVSQAQEHTSYAYDQALKYNKNNVQPWYNKKVLPFVIDAKDRLFLFYNTKVVPFTYHTLEVIEEFYHEKTVPFYHTYISPYTSSVLKLIQSEGQSKVITEEEVKAKKSKEAADKKAKVEAERKAKEEAVKRAKVEAERKAKEEADKKAKIETERKAKEEADKKAKVEAEKKAKEEADKKAKAEAERKAKEEADKKAKAEAERKAKEEADKKAKAEAERKAKEEADKKAKSESERKKKEAADKKAQEEAAGKAAIEAVNKAVHDAYNREYEIVDKNLTQTLDIYEKEATSVSQKLLKEVEDRILTLSNAGSEHLAKLKKFVEQIKKDNTKDDKTTKFNEIKDSAIKSINALKESGKEFIEISENSLNDLEEIKFNELKKNADLIMIDQVHNSRERISKLVDDKRVDERLISEINMAFSSLMAEFNGNKNEASLRVREIFAKIRKKITLLETTRDDLIKNIKDYVKMEKENLKSDANEVTTKEHGTDNKKDSDVKSDSKIIVQNDNKNDDQIPVQVEEKSSVEERSSNIPPVTIQISSDPVLGKLKARRDLVLNKLKEGYKLFKANKGNEPVQSLDYEDEEDEEDEDDDYDEEAGDNECSSGDK